MPKFIKFNAYYGTFEDYDANPRRAILFFTSVTNNVKDVEVLNEPILDWEIGKAGNITFKLSPFNVCYEAIKCKQGHIFIEQNGKLIWHGRAITDTFDEEGNREITCEGALNYLLDSHVKPLDILHYGKYQHLFKSLIDSHNRSLSSASAVILPTKNWIKNEVNGDINIDDLSIILRATGTTNSRLGVVSSPSLWKYSNFVGKSIRVSFSAEKIGSGSCSLIYGLHTRQHAIAKSSFFDDRYDSSPSIGAVREYIKQEISAKEEFSTYLGVNGLDGSSNPDYYIGFHLALDASSTVSVRITDLKVEFYYDYRARSEKTFPIDEGSRTGLERIPFHDTSNAKIIDIRDYSSTLDLINSLFIDEYGGYLFIDYALTEGTIDNYHPVLNYIYGTAEKDNPDENLPEIRYGKNLISLKQTNNWENYPTVLIPLGRQKEAWEKAVPVTGETYSSGKYLDKDGNVTSSSNTKYCISELVVKEGEVYFIYGEGKNELGLYAITNSAGDVIDHKTFSNSNGNWYSHVEIEIPYGATKLVVFFNNEAQASFPPPTTVFKFHKYVDEDLEDYITLEGYAGTRTDDLAGTKYLPSKDMVNIYDYGWIEKVVHFEDAQDQSELFAMATYYKNFLDEELTTYEVEAAELAPISGDPDYVSIGMPGSYGRLIDPKMDINKKLCVTKANVNLRNFAKSTYSLANLPPPDLSDLVAKGLYV